MLCELKCVLGVGVVELWDVGEVLWVWFDLNKLCEYDFGVDDVIVVIGV